MSAVAGPKVIRAVQVVIGVDTHQDKHVAVARPRVLCRGRKADGLPGPGRRCLLL